MNARFAIRICTLLYLLSAIHLQANPGELLWSAQTGDIVFGSPGIGPSGEIVVGSYDRKVYSFNPDGSVRWTAAVGSDWIEASPTIASDGTVYIGSWDSYLYALDGNTGTLKWKFETGGFITASPAIGPDGSVYVGSNDGFLYALSPGGILKWFTSDLPRVSPINASPVFNRSGDTVYFGTDMGDFFAISTADGSLRWSFYVTDIHPSSENYDDGIVSPAAIDSSGNIYFSCENRFLYSLTEAGLLRWDYMAADPIRSSPVISNSGMLYFIAQDGYLYFLDLEGYQQWETFIGDVLYCTPAIDAEGNIVIAGYAGSESTGPATEFTCVSPAGDILWEYKISGVNDSSPNIAPDGSIYIGAHDGKLYKLEGEAPLMEGIWPRFQANRRQTGLYEDLYSTELIDYFPLISESANGWVFIPWFGAGWLAEDKLPWIQHLDHGSIYISPVGSDAIWFYDPQLADWLYASSRIPYYYYQLGAATWLFHVPGTSIQTGRWFYDFSAMDWITDSP